MAACLSPEELSALGPAAPPLPTQQAHLAECERCRTAWRVGLEQTLTSGDSGEARVDDVSSVPMEPLGRYQRVRRADGALEVLGRGGYGHVLLAEDSLVGRKVALKELRAAQRASSRRSVVEQRLLQEARVVGQLEHPSIVPLYDLARAADGALFYVMRQIRGRTLADAIKAATTLDERLRLLPHVLAACNAVAYAHSRSVLHRDLKPQNVMVDRFGETLVIDWGLAHAGSASEESADSGSADEALNLVATDETIGEGKGRLGTPAYMSPEQLAGDRARLDAQSDVFGLGGILFEVLTGRAPRDGGPLSAPVSSVRTAAPDVPADLAALCDKALEPDRAKRYLSAQALADELDAWLHGRRVQAHVYRPWELFKRFVAEHRYTVTVGGVALVLFLVGAVVAAFRVQ